MGIFFGGFMAINVNMSLIIEPFGLGNIDVILVSISVLVTTIVCLFVVIMIMNKYQKYKLIISISVIGTIGTLVLIMLLLRT